MQLVREKHWPTNTAFLTQESFQQEILAVILFWAQLGREKVVNLLFDNLRCFVETWKT